MYMYKVSGVVVRREKTSEAQQQRHTHPKAAKYTAMGGGGPITGPPPIGQNGVADIGFVPCATRPRSTKTDGGARPHLLASDLPHCLSRVTSIFPRCRHKSIEKWAKYKEDFHLRFRWTPRRAFDVLFWGFTVPFFVFKAFTHEQVRPQISPSFPPTARLC